ncbi:MAG: hypothetical protein E7666_01630 [Ruminococcaceae bacterium]|nr:hypothetical protein [Oscillospiraceae bacterium]
MSDKIHTGHRKRARDSALKNGMKHCAEHELLEMLLYYSLPRIDTNPIAHALIERFGSVKGVLDAKVSELKAVEGIGDTSAHLIRVMAEILCRYLTDDPEKRYRFDDVGKIAEFLYPKFVGVNVECLYIMLFNNRLNLLACEKLSEGVINCSDVMTRRIAELVITTGAAAVLLAHNHPNGLAIPSLADRDTTDILRQYFDNMNVTLLDHLVFADQKYASIMRERYGTHRISPVTQRYDEEFYESFYGKGDGSVHPDLPNGGDEDRADHTQESIIT